MTLRSLAVALLSGLRVGLLVLTLLWCVRSGHWPLVALTGLLLWEMWDLARQYRALQGTTVQLMSTMKTTIVALMAARQAAQPEQPIQAAEPQWVVPGHVGTKGES